MSVKDPTLPTSAVSETIPRWAPTSAALSLTSGQLRVAYGAVIPAGATVSTITIVSGSTALSVGSNQWFALFDGSRVKLGVTADDTSTAWAASTSKTLTLSAAYTNTTGLDIVGYVGVCVVATTPPSLNGSLTATAAIADQVPKLGGQADSGLTNPASCPATFTAPASGTGPFYARLA